MLVFFLVPLSIRFHRRDFQHIVSDYNQSKTEVAYFLFSQGQRNRLNFGTRRYVPTSMYRCCNGRKLENGRTTEGRRLQRNDVEIWLEKIANNAAAEHKYRNQQYQRRFVTYLKMKLVLQQYWIRLLNLGFCCLANARHPNRYRINNPKLSPSQTIFPSQKNRKSLQDEGGKTNLGKKRELL